MGLSGSTLSCVTALPAGMVTDCLWLSWQRVCGWIYPVKSRFGVLDIGLQLSPCNHGAGRSAASHAVLSG